MSIKTRNKKSYFFNRRHFPGQRYGRLKCITSNCTTYLATKNSFRQDKISQHLIEVSSNQVGQMAANCIDIAMLAVCRDLLLVIDLSLLMYFSSAGRASINTNLELQIIAAAVVLFATVKEVQDKSSKMMQLTIEKTHLCSYCK